MTAAVPDPRFRDQLAEAHRRYGLSESASRWIADALLALIAAEVEARVQDAANQRAAEGQALRELLDVLDRINVGYVPMSLRDAMRAGRDALAPSEEPAWIATTVTCSTCSALAQPAPGRAEQ